MLKLVRRNTFETNSSSCHSVVLLSKDLPKTTSQSKEITLNLDEFGWGTDIVTNKATKLNYLFTYVVNYGSDFEQSIFIKKLKEYYPNLNTLETPEGTMSFKEFSEALEEQRFANSDKYAYIDHESVGVARKTLIEMSFSDYLSNKCTLYITNDNVDNYPCINVSLANKLGITDEIADKVVKESSDKWYTSEQYELTHEMKDTIRKLGGTVIS